MMQCGALWGSMDLLRIKMEKTYGQNWGQLELFGGVGGGKSMVCGWGLQCG